MQEGQRVDIQVLYMLNRAIERDDIDMVRHLVNDHALMIKKEMGIVCRNPLAIALMSKQPHAHDIAMLLLQKCTRHKKKIPWYGSYLHIAVECNNQEMVNFLLSKRYNVDGQDFYFSTPLHIAAANGFDDMVTCLLQHGADPNKKNMLQQTPLHLAAAALHHGIIQILVEAGSSMDEPDHAGITPRNYLKMKVS